MAKKVLVHIHSLANKRIVLPALISMGLDFVEYSGPEDFNFKLGLFKEQTYLMIHELNRMKYINEFESMKKAVALNVKVLLIIDEYDTKIIDDALSIGIHDLITFPIKEETLKSKIDSLLSSIPGNMGRKSNINMPVIENEIARAKRGNYHFSIVMANLDGIHVDDMALVIDSLKNQLRDTDLVLKWDRYRILLICPFTIKESIVEVENKIRAIVKEKYGEFKNKVILNMYGISYPKDGKSAKDLIDKLYEGLNNSIMLGNLRGGFNDIGKEDIEYYRRILNRKQW